jgi:hypothetical protein
MLLPPSVPVAIGDAPTRRSQPLPTSRSAIPSRMPARPAPSCPRDPEEEQRRVSTLAGASGSSSSGPSAPSWPRTVGARPPGDSLRPHRIPNRSSGDADHVSSICFGATPAGGGSSAVIWRVMPVPTAKRAGVLAWNPFRTGALPARRRSRSAAKNRGSVALPVLGRSSGNRDLSTARSTHARRAQHRCLATPGDGMSLGPGPHAAAGEGKDSDQEVGHG